MEFESRLFNALFAEIEGAKAATAEGSATQLMEIQNYHYNVGYWHGLNAVSEFMKNVEKKENSGDSKA